MSALRLAIVARRFWPLVGGPERLLADLAAELCGRGCTATVLTARWHQTWPSEIRLRGMPVIRLQHTAERGWGNACYVRRVARWLRANQQRFDMVCVSQLRHETHAALRAAGGRLPVVLRAERPGRFGDCQWQRDTFAGRRIAAECRRAAAVIAPSRQVEQELLTAGYPQPLVRYIPNGVPAAPARTQETHREARAVLAESNHNLELPEGAPLVVCTSRLEPECGLEQLIDAWALVVRWRPDARLWIAGQGSLRPPLQRQIETLNLGSRAMLVGLFEQVGELLAAADAFVRPAPEAGTSLALLEAIAAGLPVVASDIAGHREWITAGQDGLLAPPEDPAAWSAALLQAIGDSGLAARLGAAARRRAETFSLAKMADAHLTLFQELHDRHPHD